MPTRSSSPSSRARSLLPTPWRSRSPRWRGCAARGARQVFFKYCSTFDSTDAGNIGPVADALLDALGARFTIACPAYPENRRTIYLGHLFVGDALLSDSPMRDHPLTPMRDASLVRTLARQTRRRVGLVPWPVVARGAGTIRAEFARLSNEGVAHAIVDAIGDRDLIEIGAACADLGARHRRVRRRARPAAELPRRGVVARTGRRRCDSRRIGRGRGARRLLLRGDARSGRGVVDVPPRGRAGSVRGRCRAIAAQALAAVDGDIAAGRPVLVYSTAAPDVVAGVQSRLGRERAATLIEEAFSIVARELVARGVRRLVVAGGETAGAIVQALGVEALAIGREIDPGVPWTTALGAQPLALALKSGNFGATDFFAKALAMLPD